MIVVCIKERRNRITETFGGLTVGKQYEVLSTRASYNDWDIVEDDQYVIMNDNGIEFAYCMSYFVSLEDFRDNQIESILQ
jgi:hypothetical protein